MISAGYLSVLPGIMIPPAPQPERRALPQRCGLTTTAAHTSAAAAVTTISTLQAFPGPTYTMARTGGWSAGTLTSQRSFSKGPGFVRAIDDHLEQPRSIALDRLQRRVDLGQHLPDLATGIERRVFGHLDPMRNATMDHDVRPPLRVAEPPNPVHVDLVPIATRTGPAGGFWSGKEKPAVAAIFSAITVGSLGCPTGPSVAAGAAPARHPSHPTPVCTTHVRPFRHARLPQRLAKTCETL